MSDPDQDYNFSDFHTPATDEVRELMEKIEQSHQMRYKMMNLETWALAKTMDTFLPGFWSKFIENRRTALKQFIEIRRKIRSGQYSLDIPIAQDSNLEEMITAAEDALELSYEEENGSQPWSSLSKSSSSPETEDS